MQVGVIGGSGFYKLEELEDTKEITVFDLQTDPWEWSFCSLRIVFIEWGSNYYNSLLIA